MIDFRRSETNTTRLEFHINSPVNIGEMAKVEQIVWVQFCRANNFDSRSHQPSDDWCLVEARDNEIVFSFETSREVRI